MVIGVSATAFAYGRGARLGYIVVHKESNV